MSFLTHQDLVAVYAPETVIREEMDELVIDYLLENFYFEDEDHLLDVFENLTEDEYFSILEEIEYLHENRDEMRSMMGPNASESGFGLDLGGSNPFKTEAPPPMKRGKRAKLKPGQKIRKYRA